MANVSRDWLKSMQASSPVPLTTLKPRVKWRRIELPNEKRSIAGWECRMPWDIGYWAKGPYGYGKTPTEALSNYLESLESRMAMGMKYGKR